MGELQPSSNGKAPESGGVPDRLDLAPDGVDEKQLHEWERGCAEDMRKAMRIKVKTFRVSPG